MPLWVFGLGTEPIVVAPIFLLFAAGGIATSFAAFKPLLAQCKLMQVSGVLRKEVACLGSTRLRDAI